MTTQGVRDRHGQRPAGTALAYLGPFATLTALALCYGTVGLVAVLSVFGIGAGLKESALAPVVQVVLGLIVVSSLVSLWRHGPYLTVALSVLCAVITSLVIFIWPAKPIEYAGFVGLVATSIWDRRQKRRMACAHHAASCQGDSRG